MEQENYNVFDKVGDFYTQDPGWEEVVPRRFVEGFLREQAWQGLGEEELDRLWLHLATFSIYLGNSYSLLGDLNAEDFIDNVGWNGRNVAGFPVAEPFISRYLDSLAGFYDYLQRQHYITANPSAAKAKEWLLSPEGRGCFSLDGQPLAKRAQALAGVPDLEARVFFDMSQDISDALEMVKYSFRDANFAAELARAKALYYSFLPVGCEFDPDNKDEEKAFENYFLFDYRLGRFGVRPIELFRENFRVSDRKEIIYSNDGLLEQYAILKASVAELVKARLCFFTVEKDLGNGEYQCKDFFSGETYSLSLGCLAAIEKDFKQLIYCGHIFYNDSMVVDGLGALWVPQRGRKNLLALIDRARRFWGLRKGRAGASLKEFFQANPVFPRNALLSCAQGMSYPLLPIPDGLGDYEPAPLLKDEDNKALATAMLREGFGLDEVDIARQLWADFRRAYQQEIVDAKPWLAALIKVLLQLWGLGKRKQAVRSRYFQDMEVEEVPLCAKTIKRCAGVQPRDPRYLNQEGMLMELLMG